MKVFTVIGTILVLNAALAAAQLRPVCGCMPDVAVCGTDLKTYSSECDLHCSGSSDVQVLFRGSCEQLIQNILTNNNPLPPPYNPYYPYYNPNQGSTGNDISSL